MSLWGRFKTFVNKTIGRRAATTEYEEEVQPPPPPAIPTGDYIQPAYTPPEPFGFEPSSQDYGEPEYHFVDDFGRDWGWQSQEQWYEDSLLSHEEIIAKYGDDHLNLDLLDWYQDTFGEFSDEQWEAWRNEYEARNG